MPDIKVDRQAAKTTIIALMRQQGGIAGAMAPATVPRLVDDWMDKGVSLYVDSESVLGQALLKNGVIKL